MAIWLILLLTVILEASSVGASPVSFVCRYPTYSDGTKVQKGNFEMVFAFENPESEKGMIIGNAGSATISVVRHD